MTYTWRFNKMRPSDKAREPVQGEFFAQDAISKPGEALVREGIQNSLDARHNGEKVLVRIRVSGVGNAVARSALTPFLRGLDEHLKASGNGLCETPADDDDCPVLVFEDFGTTGLLGNPAEWKPVPGSRNHFYHFFRAEGRSDKGEKDIGRWGIGKQVFPRASQINSIFGLTVRSDDRKKLLMGMAVLKSHDVNEERYAPDGWLGCPSENGDEGLVLPIEDTAFIDAFSDTFDIQRGSAPGLTVVVPWRDSSLTDGDLVRAVLRGYFWPILREQLEVIVEAPSIETILDQKSLEQEIRNMGGDLEQEILPLVELAKWAGTLADSDYIRLKSPDKNHSWRWSKELFPEGSLSDLRDRYELGEEIAIRVPISVRERGEAPRESFFDVFLHHDSSKQSGYPVFIREGIIIPDVRSSLARGVRSLVNAEDGPIAAFLGDAENPSHTQWQHDGTNFRGKYTSGKTDLEFVKGAVRAIVSMISEQDKKEDRTLLADFFSIPALPDEQETKGRKEKESEGKKSGGKPENPNPPPPPPKPRSIIIDRVTGGFVVHNSDVSESPPPQVLLIRAAYHILRGNPFKKYRPADFDFSQRQKMEVELEGATVLEQKDNRLSVKINSSNFRIEVTGFDPKRDVRVEVRKQEDDNAGPNA